MGTPPDAGPVAGPAPPHQPCPNSTRTPPLLHNPRLLAFLEALTVGLPFCLFKFLAGILLGPWGGPLLLLCAVDAFLNLANMASLVLLKRRVAPVCAMSILVPALPRFRGRETEELATSIDVAISFLIVAIVIGGGFIRTFNALEGRAWSLAVVLNVLGAGLFQVNQAYAKLK
jgi:hypothetical protein